MTSTVRSDRRMLAQLAQDTIEGVQMCVVSYRMLFVYCAQCTCYDISCVISHHPSTNPSINPRGTVAPRAELVPSGGVNHGTLPRLCREFGPATRARGCHQREHRRRGGHHAVTAPRNNGAAATSAPLPCHACSGHGDDTVTGCSAYHIMLLWLRRAQSQRARDWYCPLPLRWLPRCNWRCVQHMGLRAAVCHAFLRMVDPQAVPAAAGGGQLANGQPLLLQRVRLQRCHELPGKRPLA